MPAKKRSPKPAAAVKPSATGSRRDPDVEALMRELDHPLKKELAQLRELFLSISPEVHEGIKWNSPSFRTTEFFATVNIRARDGQERVWLILHMGAKPKKSGIDRAKIPDPSGLLEWLGKDRCLISFRDGKDIQAKRPALEAILRAWIKQL